ncbi:MAG: Na/Pi cotransporter family protein [Clostridiales bacterium]|nr:Na/Pi cotransporter family protein [Clostridiales bacterium]
MLQAILLLLAGVGVFIAGMNMLSSGLEKSAGGGLKKMLGKISGNRFSGVGVGAGVTAIIQSSSATSVMVIGFVNAGIMTLFQATAIIMGANIGTTITGVIVSLKSLGISQYMATLAFVGVMMMFFNKDKIKQIGGILCGFGLIFVGLDVMGMAFDPDTHPEVTTFFTNLFETIDFPLLLILCGAVFTALIQSSSAATGIFIMMVGTGALTLDCALFLVLGSNIGTCITAILACLGANVNAKRTALIHLTFNVIGTMVFTIFLWIFKDGAVRLLQGMIAKPEMQLAWFHVIFNVTTTLLLLPFIKQLVLLATKVIPDKKKEETHLQLKYVDDLLLKTPPIAIMQAKKEIEYMSAVAKENFENSVVALCDSKTDDEKAIRDGEEIIDFTNKALAKYLIKLSPLVDNVDERAIGSYFHVLNDVERIGDHAENFQKIASQMKEAGLSFSETAQAELKEMGDKVMQMFVIATETFADADKGRLSRLTALENEVDEMKKELSARHFARLAEGKCKMEASAYFFSAVAGLERVADHLVNVGYSVLNPTGSQSEARQSGALNG